MAQEIKQANADVVVTSQVPTSLSDSIGKKALRHRIREIFWDSLDRSPEERRLIFKLDIFIL